MSIPPLLTRKQQHDCDELLGFALRAANGRSTAVRLGGAPRLTHSDFEQAVNERMPEKTEQERRYLLDYFRWFLDDILL